MPGNRSLRLASRVKFDDFYTKLSDVEHELRHYRHHFKDKIVFCNCDDPEYSNFWKYFELNFEYLGLKKLISTHYEEDGPSYKLEMSHDVNNDGKVDKYDIVKTPLEGNGDFRSPECQEMLEYADTVVTNPPFSLFREYLDNLVQLEKEFLIIGNQNAITYRDVFNLLQADKMWLGYHSGDMEFQVPDYYEPRETRYREDEDGVKWRSLGNICWFTNLDIDKRHEELILYKKYNEEDYPKYDNYNAINVNKVADIPVDYDGHMGVPITFMNKYNPKQFEIVGQGQGDLYRELTKQGISQEFVDDYYRHGGKGSIKENHPVLCYYDKDNKPIIPYMRILIKKKGE